MALSWKLIFLFLFFACVSFFLGFERVFFSELNVSTFFRFFYVLLVWVWSPGILAVFWAGCPLRKNGFWILGFATGTIILTGLFILSKFFGFQLERTFAGPISLLILCFSIVYCGSYRQISLSKIASSTLWFWVAGLLLSSFVVVLFFYSNPFPDVVQGTSLFKPDFLWTMGNIESFKRSFPPFDARVSGIPFHYHYFSMVYRAALGELGQVETFFLMTLFYPILNLYFLIFSLKFFYDNYARRKRNEGSRLFVLLCLTTSCASLIWKHNAEAGLFFNTFQNHIFMPTHGLEMAMPFLVLILGIFLRNSVWHVLFKKSLYIFIFLFSAMATGLKGPAGALAVVAAGAFALFSLFNKKTGKCSLLILLSCFLGFFCVYYFIISGGNPNTDGGLQFDPGWLVRKSFAFLSGKKEILSIIFVPLHLFLFLPFGFYGTLRGMWGNFRNKKKINVREGVVIIPAVAGIIGAYVFSHPGMSNLYFLFLAIPFLNMYALSWNLENWHDVGFGEKVFCILLVSVVFISSASMTYTFVKRSVVVSSRIQENSRVIRSREEYNMTKGEFRALRWVSQNTPRSSVLAGERYYSFGKDNEGRQNARFFYYSAFSERQLYLEGWEYSALSKNEDGKKEIERRISVMARIFEDKYDSNSIMLSEGIDFIIVSKKLRPTFEFRNLKLAYSNDEAAVFESVTDP